MKRPTPARISTEGASAGGCNPAFAHLNPAAFPDLPNSLTDPVEKPPVHPDPGWKMGRVVLQRQTAQRGGKTVLVLHDFATHLPPSVIERLARQLRAACGCGGTVKDRRIEIQGDQPAKIRTLLEAAGFQVAGIP